PSGSAARTPIPAGRILGKQEPTTVAHALADPDWVEAMQAEIQQFRNQKVWVLVTLPNEKRAVRTKWILKNKRDTKGIVCRNKASYLKPFGCYVTILNTSDLLGKFEKSQMKVILLGIQFPVKLYRVYNLVSRKIEETMNLKFLENKPIVAGTSQAWMFDIDYLT
nr:ribonuclease H-like domain-containing protein [Tanacetum cinerariifolium]